MSKKKIAIWLIVLIIAITAGTCSGCMDAKSESAADAKAESVATAEANAEGGKVETGDIDIRPETNIDVAPDVDVTGLEVKSVTENNENVEAKTTFADVAMRLLDDTLFRWSLLGMLITGCVFMVYIMVTFAIIINGFYTGDIDPRKPRQHKG